jgi:glycosyltransferase involved in cell wall biosynthesis
MPDVVIAVPCYNEASRIDSQALLALLAEPRVGLVLVDDGSNDDTLGVLQRIASHDPARIEVLALRGNSGKAEAVRRGLLAALEHGPTVIGYLDADLSTPPAELLNMLRVLESSGAAVAMGSRVRMLGRNIERKATRHYLGRVFATLASLVLGLPVYDTQCGAKLFRDGPAIRRALDQRFRTGWAFDVELILRLISKPGPVLDPGDLIEVPLREWRDAGGSKLTLPAMIGAVLGVIRLAWQRLRSGRS